MVKGMREVSSPNPDLQPTDNHKSSSNVLMFHSGKSLAATMCNTSYVSKEEEMHTTHAIVGLAASASPQHIIDIQTMTEAALKRAYPKEHNSWRSRRSGAGKESLPWAPEFDQFSGFLRVVGPKPKEDHQLDKIVKDAGYVPGNIRWVSPRENVLNRDHTRFLTHNGETHPVAVWARKVGVPKDTIFSRLRRGWPASEAITGQHISDNNKQRGENPTSWPWHDEYRDKLEEMYQNSGMRVPRLYYYLWVTASNLISLQTESAEWHEANCDPNELTEEQTAVAKNYFRKIETSRRVYQHALQKVRIKVPGFDPGNPYDLIDRLKRKKELFVDALK